MMMGCHKLEVDTFAVHEDFQTGGTLVVKHMENWAEATVSEIEVQVGIGP